MLTNKKILIIAGEASGDLQGANLVAQIKKLNSQLQFYGLGGEKMQAAGVELIENVKNLSVIGVVEIIRHFPFLYSVHKKFKNIIMNERPDLVILVDCPGFNLCFAKIAKKAGCKVFYYISPQLWAWHQSRAKIIKQNVDVMAVLFPFEVDFYRKFGIKAKFVGHPLIDIVKPTMSVAETKKVFDVQEKNSASPNPVIGLLPGSRKSEIKRLLPIMVQTAQLLKQKFSQAQFILPLAPTLTIDSLQPYLKNTELDIKIIKGRTYDVVNICDAVIITSGTATLETALLEKPMAILYQAPLLTLGKIFIKTSFFGICNIIAGKAIVKEFIQAQAQPQKIAEEINKILTDENYRETMTNELRQIKNRLQSENVSNAAELVLGLLIK